MKRRFWLIAGGCVVALLVLLVVVLGVNSSGLLGAGSTTAASAGSSASSASGQDGTAQSSPASSSTSSPVGTDATSSSPAQSVPPSTAAATLSAAQKTLNSLTLEQKVGQLLMVSSPVSGPDANTLAALNSMHVGNVFLSGRGYDGVQAVAGVVEQLKSTVGPKTTGGVKQFIATDQEGGLVQIMNGPGFSAMPSALEQGTLTPAQLQTNATLWGQQLAAAGVNVNFAPVLDTVPSAGFAPQNAPIGYFNRQYGYTPQTVSAHGVAVALGFEAGGVAPTVKHFPGLGRVTANTDVASGVTDSVTSRNDPYLLPFQDAIKQGVRWVMVSNAFYRRSTRSISRRFPPP